jgi:hypothetical protein
MRQVRIPSGRVFIGARLHRAVLVGVGVAAIVLGTAPGALATTVIGNTPPWAPPPSGGIASGFGVSGSPNFFTPTYGQTVTVPATDTKLDSFTFYADLPTNLFFRGEVYAWDPTTTDPINSPFGMGSAAGSVLYESGQMHTTSYGAGSTIQPITFNIPGGLQLNAGAQYVLIITTSVDFAANAGVTATSFFGYTFADTYSDGDWVYVDDGGNPGLWTTLVWTHPALFPSAFPNQDDLAFQATFSGPQDPTSTSVACSPGTVAVGKPSRCTATVTDTAGSGQTTPNGTVTFGSGGPGRFTGSPCTLAQTSPGVASCQVTYIPGASGTPTRADTITATYNGDPAHLSSSGTTAVRVQPTTNGDCMNGGWRNYGFANQGLCIQFVQTHGG